MMRLNTKEIAAIKSAALEAFGANAVVRLFGSRVHDYKHGGDIDLHFEIDPGCDNDQAINRFESRLFEVIDEQKIDKIFAVRGAPTSPFQQIGYRDGIIL
jgi:uncharacterized protein